MGYCKKFVERNRSSIRAALIVGTFLICLSQLLSFSLSYPFQAAERPWNSGTSPAGVSVGQVQESDGINSAANSFSYLSGPYKSNVAYSPAGQVLLLNIDGLSVLNQTPLNFGGGGEALLVGLGGQKTLSIGLSGGSTDQSLVLQYVADGKNQTAAVASPEQAAEAYSAKAMWSMIFLFLVVVLLIFWIVLEMLHNTSVRENLLLSEREKLAEKDRMILHQSRLASVGELTGDLVHQWKQPLNSLMLIISNLESSYEDGDLETIHSLGKEARSTIRLLSTTADDFRTFLKPDLEMTDFDVSEVIEFAIHNFSERAARYNISVRFQSDGNTRVFGYRNQLLQVVLNLIGNSIDAISERHIPNGMIVLATSEQKKEIILSVQDNGGGVAPENVPKLFQAYFTTKGTGGTGLGLFMSKRIIEENFKGILAFQNAPEGAVFRITLPKYGE
jgi:signal transduction histidine kinase